MARFKEYPPLSNVKVTVYQYAQPQLRNPRADCSREGTIGPAGLFHYFSLDKSITEV